jgi:methylmalonyl-CoA/ethylmalonyl-CoA epimerase
MALMVSASFRSRFPVGFAAGIMVDMLHQVALGCTDLDSSVGFYTEKIGLSCIARFDPPGIAFFQLGETRLLLERSDSCDPGSSVLYLLVGDIRARYDALRSLGVVFDSEPVLIHTDHEGTFGDRGTQEWMAFFRDPDHNRLALAERRPPGAPGV